MLKVAGGSSWSKWSDLPNLIGPWSVEYHQLPLVQVPDLNSWVPDQMASQQPQQPQQPQVRPEDVAWGGSHGAPLWWPSGHPWAPFIGQLLATIQKLGP
jgi:hypothetical protein